MTPTTQEWATLWRIAGEIEANTRQLVHILGTKRATIVVALAASMALERRD